MLCLTGSRRVLRLMPLNQRAERDTHTQGGGKAHLELVVPKHKVLGVSEEVVGLDFCHADDL